MFKSIFSKLVVIFICILLVGFSITGVTLYYFLRDYVSEQKVQVLEDTEKIVNNWLTAYLQSDQSATSTNNFVNVLSDYSNYSGAIILITNTNGEILQTAPRSRYIPDVILKNLRDKSGNLRFTDERQYKKVISSGEELQEISDFYGIFKDTGYAWLTLAKPYEYNGKIIGAIYLHTPMPEVHKVSGAVFRLFMISVSVSVVISIILVYIFSRRFTRPLKEINKAASIIASGEFRERLNIRTKDEIGELANSFNQMVSSLENLEEMRRGFIANVSHELRTPMTSIRGFVEGILDGTIPPERQNQYLAIVRDETTRLSRMVNDLLDLAKMESGEITLSMRSFDINELVRRAILKLESLVVEKNLQVEAIFDEEETMVYADPDAIERVLINLMHNAIKFTPEEGRIHIGTSVHKDSVQLVVEDNGSGINRDEIDLIWDRFYKSDKSRSQDKSGTGLGLAIVRNIILEHKQRIWVESEPGKGTRFYFTLNRTFTVS